jgi:cell division protein FtsW
LGNGIQKFGYLPESHTDFVFAILCEETGILGGGLVIALFCAFAWLGVRTMMAAASPFERMLGFGITLLITTQAAINIAVVTVMMPTTGVPLPMISAGGSGLLMVCVAVGLLCAIARRGGAVAAPGRAMA